MPAERRLLDDDARPTGWRIVSGLTLGDCVAGFFALLTRTRAAQPAPPGPAGTRPASPPRSPHAHRAADPSRTSDRSAHSLRSWRDAAAAPTAASRLVCRRSAQFISTAAARFRGISDTIGRMGLRSGSERDADGHVLYPNMGTRLPDLLVDMENDWGNLSQRFNRMLANRVQRDSRQNVLSGAYRRLHGTFVRERLFTMEQSSRVLNAVKGYPGSP
ncbi:hypothetical protein SCAB_2531 [Streptomyces scabiei 87.22]|uniref:Uncharacterized protein n=2 Tax=Streptomyces TaxID=1883 RepID=C9ZEK8_STRSW|nr:hypothetical protein SCAB_2531 [Streptomyces scabiei 87.22]